MQRLVERRPRPARGAPREGVRPAARRRAGRGGARAAASRPRARRAGPPARRAVRGRASSSSSTRRPGWSSTPRAGRPHSTVVNALLHRLSAAARGAGARRPARAARGSGSSTGSTRTPPAASSSRAPTRRSPRSRRSGRGGRSRRPTSRSATARSRSGAARHALRPPPARPDALHRKLGSARRRASPSGASSSGSGRTATLAEVTLHTGRTHQIRVHLAEAGHPLLGDAAYGGTRREARRRGGLAARARPRRWGARRCTPARLAFDHPRTGRRVAFEAPLPADFGGARSRCCAARGRTLSPRARSPGRGRSGWCRESSGTVFVLEITSASGTATISGGLEGDHHVPLPLGDEADRGRAEAERQEPVEGGRRAAALQVAEDQRAGLLAGALARSRCATRSRDAAEAAPPCRPPSAFALVTISPPRGRRALGHDHDAVALAVALVLARCRSQTFSMSKGISGMRIDVGGAGERRCGARSSRRSAPSPRPP